MDSFLEIILPWILKILVLSIPIYGFFLIYVGYLKPKNQNVPINRIKLLGGILLVSISAFILFAPISR